MDIQKACDILEGLLNKESMGNKGNLTTEQFFALNAVLFEMQLSGKHIVKEGDAK